VIGGRGGKGGAEGGGGDSGGSEGGGGGSGDGGVDGGEGYATVNSAVAEAPSGSSMENGPWLKPSAYHSASFQPSPNESTMFSVQLAPMATANSDSDAYGAPPATLVPSVHPKVQLTSLG